ncbi:uncharacterized mitochondrial membrane protein Fmp10p [[Candida] railenensis]|uniref:Uncharacterized mitochondrial membrane protein Fmp10p n=1 Tax=[Candida] railenensis TaxID=45579 RepID=A0A9P0QPW9_9ASCO|nr:uncharacterized mitochondrial membrane protein Fmp10p [[Candida] railenensis]
MYKTNNRRLLGLGFGRKLTCFRQFATRGEFDSPFDHLPKRAPKSWFNWKTTALFFVGGSYLAYNETLFDLYSDYTDSSADDQSTRLKLEYELKNLPIYEKLAYPKKGENWVQMKSWENLDKNVLEAPYKIKTEEEYSKPALTNKILAQKGGIAVEPVIFHNIDTDEGVTIVHVGYRLCGYPFLVHGGMLATLLNETFKRNASLSSSTSSNIKGDFKVENLSISYRYPSLANQFLIIKTRPSNNDNDDPKHIHLSGVILSQNGKTLVKSDALLVDTGRESNKIKAAKKKSWW